MERSQSDIEDIGREGVSELGCRDRSDRMEKRLNTDWCSLFHASVSQPNSRWESKNTFLNFQSGLDHNNYSMRMGIFYYLIMDIC